MQAAHDGDYLLRTTFDGQTSDQWVHSLATAQRKAKRARSNGATVTVFLLIDAMLLPEDQW